ncbi:MAG: enoyl-CoA hydratase/isomerase family protein [bacterium]|nr:enoyl-CoA hydratase/isomerase family protein [bacterium]
MTTEDGRAKAHGGKYSEEHPNEALSDEMTAQEIDDLVLYEKVDRHIAVITLNRPEKANAFLAPYGFTELARKFKRAENDDEIKVIVLTGAGGNFCSGVDLRRTPVEAAGMRPGKRTPQSMRMRMESYEAPEVWTCDKTVIAAVDGACVAAGFHFMMGSDMVIAAEDARFGEPETRIGFAGFAMGWHLLVTKIGANKARELVLFGELKSAQQMYDWGVVNKIVPKGEVKDEAMRWAKAVAWHSTDNLMLGKRSMQFYYQLLGFDAYEKWVSVAHPMFTNVVWREDEFNFMRERNKLGMKGALNEMKKQWNDMGFS